jgi:hypothetical protein
MQNDISNELKDKEMATLAEITQRKAQMSESRRETLDKMRFANGYNLISGEIKTSDNCTIDKPRGKKHLSPCKNFSPHYYYYYYYYIYIYIYIYI